MGTSLHSKKVRGMATFSERHGYKTDDQPIQFREEASPELRQAIWALVQQCELTGIELADTVLANVFHPKFGAYRPVLPMAEEAMFECEWNVVYDLVEHFYRAISRRSSRQAQRFEQGVNEYFRKYGYGWKVVGGVIEVRGPEAVQSTIEGAIATLKDAGKTTAANELKEALHDLSRRPEPDITGAIQHAGAALECVAREASGDPKRTLGAIVAKYPDLLPKPLDNAVEQIWGYVSNQGRHLKEGDDARHDVAYLVTGLAAAIAAFMVDKEVS